MRTPLVATIISSGAGSARHAVVLDESGKLDISTIPDDVTINTVITEIVAASNITVTPIINIVASNAQEAFEALESIKLSKSDNLSSLANKATSRTNLGLGSIATQNSDNVTLTGGSIDGVVLGQTVKANAFVTNLSAEINVTSLNLRRGAGNPNTVFAGRIGDMFQRTDGGVGTSLYVKESDDNGVTGWTPLLTASAGDINFVFNQGVPSATWVIVHNLGKYPSITIVDSAKNTVIGNVTYDSINQVTITFSAGFSGQAFLN